MCQKSFAAAGFTPRNLMSIPVAALVLVAAFSPGAWGRQWHDESGRFKVEAEIVSANSELVVLRTTNGRLLAVELAELSEKDREFVAQSLKREISPPLRSPDGDAPPPPPDVTIETPDATVQTPAGRAPEERRLWKLLDNTTIRGDFFGFDFEPLIISRRLGKVYVGKTAAEDLNPIYQTIIPLAVAQLEGADITSMRKLEDWLKKSGAGPWNYPMEAVVLETPEHGRVSVPLVLLDPAAREALGDAYQRWKAAYESEGSEEDKERYMDRERFLTRAQLAELAANEAMRQQVQLLRLEQLAAATDITELWEVVLIPPNFGYPVSVVIIAPTSAAAQQIARAQYPAFGLAGIQKASW